VDVLWALGGAMELSDLAAHTSSFPEPLSVRYGDVEVFEVGPNGQGIAALMALNVLEAMRREGDGVAAMRPLGAQVLHTQIEAMRLAFADARAFVADPDCVPVPVRGMLDAAYAAQRRALIDPARARAEVSAGSPQHGSDTVSFQVVDARGNAVSMVNSNYEGFGSGIVPRGCGFTLQNRGANFSLRAEHPNVVAPRKRPFHTIIPAIVLHADTRELFATLTNMGGFMQPSGHLQLVCNLVDFTRH
jgi:gamma-glutamyltranspeptidase/glutathione hydrolase